MAAQAASRQLPAGMTRLHVSASHWLDLHQAWSCYQLQLERQQKQVAMNPVRTCLRPCLRKLWMRLTRPVAMTELVQASKLVPLWSS